MRQSIMAVALVAGAAWGQVSVVGDIVVVSDPSGAITNLVAGMNPGVPIPSPQEQFCRAAYNQLRTVLGDDYDGIVAFTTSEQLTDLNNVWQGSPVRVDGTGYGRTNQPWANTYQGQKLGQCVFMGTLGRTAGFIPGMSGTEALPAQPDDAWKPSLGIPLPGVSSLTGIEMLGHEYGHHWLMGIEFDQADGRGPQHFIRAFNDDSSTGGGAPNQHYSHLADSRSVMYGECITDLGNGSFRIAGCQRKYSHIDQYLMGLRAPEDVTPMLVLEDPANPGRGVDSVALGATASAKTVTGYTRHDVSADDIIRAMGSRSPAWPVAKHCWKVAFVVVLTPGQTAVPAAMLAKVERYRARWGPWFQFATDGRGTMDTQVYGTTCDGTVLTPDAGTPVVDAGAPVIDAGTPVVDAGTQPPEFDAGSHETLEPDAGAEAPDAGDITDTPQEPVDAGPSKWDSWQPPNTLRPGCGCGATGGLGALWLLALAAAARRRRR